MEYYKKKQCRDCASINEKRKLETLGEVVVCSCKGIRTCAICDHIDNEKIGSLKHEVNHNVVEFKYDPVTAEAVILPEMKTGRVCERFKFPGVIIYADFISSFEEKELIEAIDSTDWKPSQSGRYKQDFGPKVNFKKQKIKVSSFSGLPNYSKRIVDRMQHVQGLEDFKPVELCNLEYTPERGSSIDPHFDDSWLWGERLVTLNLSCDSWLTMTLGDENSFQTGKNLVHGAFEPDKIQVKIPLKQRSLVMLFDKARKNWKHGIMREDIKERRLCCTFRELSNEFLSGNRKEDGKKLLAIASQYCGTIVW